MVVLTLAVIRSLYCFMNMFLDLKLSSFSSSRRCSPLQSPFRQPCNIYAELSILHSLEYFSHAGVRASWPHGCIKKTLAINCSLCCVFKCNFLAKTQVTWRDVRRRHSRALLPLVFFCLVYLTALWHVLSLYLPEYQDAMRNHTPGWHYLAFAWFCGKKQSLYISILNI